MLRINKSNIESKLQKAAQIKNKELIDNHLSNIRRFESHYNMSSKEFYDKVKSNEILRNDFKYKEWFESLEFLLSKRHYQL